tara:strand:+ start:1379 stop:1696 length:318 start_codon:yes stop_codon:yes gene_type:complete
MKTGDNLMPRTIRSTNLDLIRWLNYGHESTANKLSALTNANYLSKMATGDMAIDDEMARSIESTLELPPGWMDRDNLGVLKMPVEAYKLSEAIRELPLRDALNNP